MKCKWIAATLAAALLACLPVACAGGGGQSAEATSPAIAASENMPAAEDTRDEPAGEEATESGVLRQIDYSSSVIEVPGGLLLATAHVDEQQTTATGDFVYKWKLWMVDVESRQQSLLCTVDTTGLDLRSESFRPPRLFAAGGEVYFIDRSTVNRLDLADGSYQQIFGLVRLAGKGDDEYDETDYYEFWHRNLWYTDGEYLYAGIQQQYVANEMFSLDQGPKQLTRISLATGAREALYDIRLEFDEPAACHGQDILFDTLLLPQNTFNFYNEDRTRFDNAAAEANLAAGVHELRAVNSQTGEMRTLYREDYAHRQLGAARSDGETVYAVNRPQDAGMEGPSGVYTFDFDGGTWAGPLYATEGDNLEVEYMDARAGRMLVRETSYELGKENGLDPAVDVLYWCVGLNGTPPTPWRLLMQDVPREEDVFYPMLPLAAYGGYYLVQTRQESITFTLHGDGTLVQAGPPLAFGELAPGEDESWSSAEMVYQYALILAEDYWASRENYLPLTVTED